MREIRFRAWDGHRMQYDFTIDSEDGVPRLIGYSIHGAPNDVALSFKVMQFTGLQDNSGADIYEGDIITYRMGGVPLTCEFIWYGEKSKFGVRGSGELTIYGVSRDDISDRAAIIGNIHQNPELLGGDA